MVISADGEKVFDSVNWNFLCQILHRFHFNETIIKAIQAIYDKPTARVKVNGELSDSFTLKRGARQSCTCSPLLFVIYLEPFTQHIRQNKEITGNNIKGEEHRLVW